ncbi:MAG: hypothetical protein AVDCRST_MAG20-206, partial [uncultured Acidimicrobiales bacterium]
ARLQRAPGRRGGRRADDRRRRPLRPRRRRPADHGGPGRRRCGRPLHRRLRRRFPARCRRRPRRRWLGGGRHPRRPHDQPAHAPLLRIARALPRPSVVRAAHGRRLPHDGPGLCGVHHPLDERCGPGGAPAHLLPRGGRQPLARLAAEHDRRGPPRRRRARVPPARLRRPPRVPRAPRPGHHVTVRCGGRRSRWRRRCGRRGPGRRSAVGDRRRPQRHRRRSGCRSARRSPRDAPGDM